MRIVDLINRELIISSLAATNKSCVLDELSNHLSAHYSVLDAGKLVSILRDRENLASTAIGDGVAIPHGKLSSLSNIVACLGRSRQGINFDSIDGKPTHLFFVLIAPENSVGTHLKALARIARLFQDTSLYMRLVDAKDAKTMYDILVEEDAKS